VFTRKKVATLVALVAIVGLIASCAPPTPEKVVETVVVTKEVPVEVTKEVIVTPVAKPIAEYVLVGPVVHPYCNTVYKAAEKAAEELGVTMYFLTPVDFDATRQLEMIEDVMTWPGVKGIAVHPGDPHAFDSAYDELQAKGIKLVVAGGGCVEENPHYPLCFSTDFYKAGWKAAEHMAELLDHKGKVAIALGWPQDINVVKRANGMADYIKQNEPNMEVLEVVKDMDSPEGSVAGAEYTLSAYPDVDAIIGTCWYCGVGPAAVVEATGRTDVLVVYHSDYEG